MDSLLLTPAAITQSTPEQLALSGDWTARGLGVIGRQLDELSVSARLEMVVDGSRIVALDTAGAWVLQKLLRSLRGEAGVVRISDLRPEFASLLKVVGLSMLREFAPLITAIIIAVIGCFQGLRTRGGADSVGRQTTRSVVQSTFLVIVADALLSVVFSALDL